MTGKKLEGYTPGPRKAARAFIETLPSNPGYQAGEIMYPPQGLVEIANLCAAFHADYAAQAPTLLEQRDKLVAVLRNCIHALALEGYTDQYAVRQEAERVLREVES